ncbi:MAG TPA: hypothetical protein VGW33_03225 [Terriglobia bacterium]|nr:hypothetical protein [Terriglobia bacterium]
MKTKPSARRSERVSNLSESSLQRLNLYALAAGAAGVSLLALAPPAEAEVVFTPAHVEIMPNGGGFQLDLNHDGIDDFRFGNNAGFYLTHLSVGIDFDRSMGGIQVKPGSHFFSALALNRGAKIGSSKSFNPCSGCSSYQLNMASVRDNGDLGDWVNVTNRYLGLKFPINGETHFGWARLSVGVRGTTIEAILTGYAYETIANHPILAGQTSGTADDTPGAEARPAFRRQHSKPASQVQPGSLGVLALGAPGIPFWRREEEAAEW